MVDEFPQAQVPALGLAGRSRPALATRRWSSKRISDTVGFVLWQHLLGALVSGRVSVPKPSPRFQHPLASSRAVPKDVLRWIRV